MKTCFKCKETKSVSSFYKNKTKKDKLDTSCKECSKQRYYLWREQNYQKALEYNRKRWKIYRYDKYADVVEEDFFEMETKLSEQLIASLLFNAK
jgi:hypothetical protein